MNRRGRKRCGYNYLDYKDKILTDEGQREFLKLRDWVLDVVEKYGAVNLDCIVGNGPLTGENWFMCACVDRMVEIGELDQIIRPKMPSQLIIYVKKGE